MVPGRNIAGGGLVGNGAVLAEDGGDYEEELLEAA
jgi:hypothetical protein